MPCHPARARELVRKGRAPRRFSKGLFYLRLLDRAEGAIQPVACGIDPGSKQEGLTVKSEAHTFLNLQADAVTWVKDALKTRREMRRGRRFRKTPCRQPRFTRARGGIPLSTKARWQWKLRIARWLSKLYPISVFVVEDVKARTKGQRRWDASFSPRSYGGTRSLGFKRGSLVKHPKYGVTYVGGTMNGRLSLHSLEDGKRLCQNAKSSDCQFLAYASWRTRLLPGLKTGGSAA
jgi:hypothetical protein